MGISYEGDLIDLGANTYIIKKSGTWYSYGNERLGQGKEAARKFLKENPELTAEIDGKVRAHFGIAAQKAAPAGDKPAVKAGDKQATPAGDKPAVTEPRGAAVTDKKPAVGTAGSGVAMQMPQKEPVGRPRAAKK